MLAPLVRGQKGEYRDLFDDLLKQGFVRARVDGHDRPAHRQPAARSADAAQHRGGHRPAGGRPGLRARLAEAVDLALKMGEGNLIVALDQRSGCAEAADRMSQMPSSRSPRRGQAASRRRRATDLYLSAHYACTHCGLSFEPPSPQLFSFNSPQGMCTTCDGLGELYTFDPERLVPDREPVVQARRRSN